MLKMTDISKIYRTELIETHALRELELHVEEGEFISITGPSGSGKTTFLNIAGLLESPSSGTYLLDGQDVSHLNDLKRSRIRNEKVGFIFQSFNLIPDLNLADNVEVPLRYRGWPGSKRREAVGRMLELVGLGSRHAYLPSQLSGGQQQRVAIARALAGEPRFLLADEPTGNLDSEMAGIVMNLLESINNDGTTIVMVTHDNELAMKAHRNIHILDGRASDVPETTPAVVTPLTPPREALGV
jgi:putative ABC transport system ATP-binding protein